MVTTQMEHSGPNLFTFWWPFQGPKGQIQNNNFWWHKNGPKTHKKTEYVGLSENGKKMWCYFFGPQLFLSSSIAYYKPARQANFGKVGHLWSFFDWKPLSGLMCIVITTTITLLIPFIILTMLINTIKAVKCDSGGTLLKQLSVQLLR